MDFTNNYVYIINNIYYNDRLYKNTKNIIYYCRQELDYFDNINLYLVESLLSDSIRLWVAEFDLELVSSKQQYILEVIYGKKTTYSG